MNKNRICAILYFIAAFISYIVALIWLIGPSGYLGCLWLCLGSAMLCLGSVYLNKCRNEEEAEEEEQDTDTKNQ